MVADRLKTDLQFGKAGGLAALLAFTGVVFSPHFHIAHDS